MTDVLVIGGGPAGASFAARMAQLGHDVTLVESQAFPRARLGESLTPGLYKLLAATGAWSAVEQAGFPRAGGVRLLWEDGDVIRAEADGLLVDRGRFDALLLAHAAREGVRVLQPARVLSETAGGSGWSVTVEHDGGCEAIRAGLLADARGRHAGFARRAMGERTLALSAAWHGGAVPPHATVAAGESGWFWGLPLPDGRYVAQAFLAPRDFRGAGGQSLEQRYRRLIAASPLAPGLAGARLAGAVQAIDATPYLALEPVAARAIRLGDAAISLDPMSSSGVQKAVQTALSGAIVANTLLRRPSAGEIAHAFYRDSLTAAAERHRDWTGERYLAAARTRPDAFWRARARPAAEPAVETVEVSPLEEVALSAEARISDCPCLGTEFVEQRPALLHPALEGPVAFVAQQPLAPLLAGMQRASLASLARGWSHRMPFDTAVSIAVWLRRKRVLVPAPDARPGAAA